MAQLRLRDTEIRPSRLPQVCMVCGEPSEDHIEKNFSWFPPWVGILIFAGLLPYVIIVMLVTKRMTVSVPVCGRHRWYFGKRTLLIWLALFACLGLSGAVLAGGMVLAGPRDQGGAFGLACVTFVLSLVVAIVIIAVIQTTTIRPKEITDFEITLVRVNDSFVDAFDAMRQERRGRRDARRDDDDYEPPPRSRYDEEDDSRPGRRSDSFRAERDDEGPPRRRSRYEDDE